MKTLMPGGWAARSLSLPALFTNSCKFYRNYHRWTNEICFLPEAVSLYCTSSTGRHGLEFLFYIQYLYDHHCRLADCSKGFICR